MRRPVACTSPRCSPQQVKRMLASPRAETLVTNFAFQWLNVARLDEIVPDPRRFPYAAGASRIFATSSREELRYFVGERIQADCEPARAALVEPHVPEREARASLRHHDGEGRSVPACHADPVRALRPAGQGRGADAHVVPGPHGARSAWRVDSRAHQRHAAGNAAAERRQPAGERRTGKAQPDAARAHGACTA